MYKDGDDADDAVTINVENTEIRCNRKKLSECSHYFSAMFSGNFRESHEKTVKIRDVKSSVFVMILQYVEDAHFVENDDLLDVLEGACMLQIDDLREHCVKRLTEDLSVATCLQVWQMCDRLNVQPLATKAKCKALVEFNSIKDSGGVASLNLEELHAYLASTYLHCENELDVFETGMKWWYERSKDGQSPSIANECLITILNCLDYECVSRDDIDTMKYYPDVAGNVFVTDVLDGFLDDGATLPADVRAYVNTLKRDRKRRDREVLPCIASRDIVYNAELSKRLKKCDTTKNSNIYFYDRDQKVMRKFINTHFHDNQRCNDLLEGYHMLAYKENILFFGGQYKYGSNEWSTHLWMYNTIKEKWEIVTRLPKERRHFKSYIVNDKLFIIGGTGRFRIIQDDMFYYDFAKDEWTTNITLPQPLFNVKCCELRKQLFLMSGSFLNKFGYLYSLERSTWQRLDIQDKDALVTRNIDAFLLFSDDDRLYIKADCLIELELVGDALQVVGCEPTKPLDSDECAYFKSGRHLYIFSKIDAYCDNTGYCALSRYRLADRTSELLLIYEQTYDHTWLLNAGCFGLFHYSVVSRDARVSRFARCPRSI